MQNQKDIFTSGKINPARNSEAGFTLVQIALGIIVLSIIAVPLAKLYQMEQAKHKVTLNLEKMDRIVNALNKFGQLNTRLPNPADPTLAFNHADYGQEVDISATQACTSMFSAKKITCATNAGSDVLIGAVPFLALGINEDDTIDLYGMKMTYAVTRTMTKRATYGNGGKIAVLNQDGNKLNGGVENPTQDDSGASNVIYVVTSHGGDRRGAYDRSGSLTACGTTGMDKTNCSGTGIFRGMQKTNSGALIPGLSDSVSLAIGSNYFDDTIRFRNTVLDGMWAQQKDVAATGDGNIYMSGRMRVMIGATKFPANADDIPKHMLDVRGDVAASNRIISKSLCANSNDASTDCFRIKNLSGNTSDTGADKPVKCGTGPLTKIEKDTANKSAKEICNTTPSTLSSNKPSRTCPNGIGRWNGSDFVCN